MMIRFRNRIDAGQHLARSLEEFKEQPDVMVLALPRGGVPVAFQVARELHAPLDVFIVRKLGVPGHEELAMGAIASGGCTVLRDDIIEIMHLPRGMIEAVIDREETELVRRESVYREGRPPLNVVGKTVLLIDDGLATGATMHAAVKALRQLHPHRIVVAVPVAPNDTLTTLRGDVDQIVCLATPEPFFGVGQWYDDFDQTTDEEVLERLETSVGFAARDLRKTPGEATAGNRESRP